MEPNFWPYLLLNIDQVANFFQCHTPRKICNETILKDGVRSAPVKKLIENRSIFSKGVAKALVTCYFDAGCISG